MHIVEEHERHVIVKEEDEYKYIVKIPKITPEEYSVIKKVMEYIIKEFSLGLSAEDSDTIKKRILQYLREENIQEEKLHSLAEIIFRKMYGYDLIDFFLEDDNLEEVMVIGRNLPVYVFHRKYGMMETNIVFRRDRDIVNIIEKIARECGRTININNPLLDARLPNGDRVNATLSPPALDGPTITIRKFKRDPLTIVDILKFKTLSIDAAAFLWLVVDGLGVKPGNIIVAGGTGSGKTTTLNCLASFMKKNLRVVTIEDVAELQLPIKHKIRLEIRPPNVEGKGEITFDHLLKNTLRMRPDRIIVGEIRGEEALTLFTAMNTGHDGCMGTIHANSASETITRLINPPMNVPMVMIPALDIIIIQQRFNIGGRTVRRITEISEIGGIEMDRVLLNKIYEYNAAKDSLQPTGVPSKFIQELSKRTGLGLKEINEEILKRSIVLQYLVKNNIRDLTSIHRYIQEYYRNPDELLEKIERKLKV